MYVICMWYVCDMCVICVCLFLCTTYDKFHNFVRLHERLAGCRCTLCRIPKKKCCLCGNPGDSIGLAILRSWPFCDDENVTFSRVKWPPTRGYKGHFESPGGNTFPICGCCLVPTMWVNKRIYHDNVWVQERPFSLDDTVTGKSTMFGTGNHSHMFNIVLSISFH